MNLTFAYVDPGLGLLIWQSVVATALGLVFYFKKTRDKVRLGLRKLFRTNVSEPAVEKVKAEPDKVRQ